MTAILIKNGRVIDPANKIDRLADLLIENGKIKKIGAGLKHESAKIIDARGKIVSPGFVDLHVHLREPGREDKETILTASRAAAKGGVTSVVAMPNTTPVADNQSVLEYVLSKAKKDSLVNVFVSGAITKGESGKEIAEIWEMKNSGAVAVTDDGFDVQNQDVYLKAMEYCKTHNMPIISHSEDRNLGKGGLMHEGVVSSRMGLPGIPACTEDIATSRILFLAEEVGQQVHFTHVTTKNAVDLIRMGKKNGLKISADVTPHHIALTDEAVTGYNTLAKVNPPLRSEDHRQALIKGLKDGTIDAIATDHAPHLWTEKEREFDGAPTGCVGLETTLPIVITYLVDKKVLTLSQALAKITCNPAKVLNLDKGTLKPGKDADVTVFDPNKKQTIDRTKFESKGQNSPFHGMTLKGVVTETIVGGRIVVEGGKIVV